MTRPLSPLVYVGLALAVLTASNGLPQPAAQENPQIGECPMEVSFAAPDAGDDWRAVNDGVMGGRSSGGPIFQNGTMIFKGDINTDGGGFSSVRSRMEKGALAETFGLNMRLKSDGRDYKVTMRTDVTYRRRLISFQAAIPPTPKGEWAEVDISFSTLDASLFGRALSGARFEAADVREIGIILADGKDGRFQLEVEWIKSICQ